MQRASSGTRKPRQPNSSPAAAKQLKVMAERNAGMNAMEKSVPAFSGLNGAMPVSHAEPNMMSPAATGSSIPAASYAGFLMRRPKPMRFRWKRRRVAIAARAGAHIAPTVYTMSRDAFSATRGVWVIRYQNIDEMRKVMARKVRIFLTGHDSVAGVSGVAGRERSCIPMILTRDDMSPAICEFFPFSCVKGGGLHVTGKGSPITG